MKTLAYQTNGGKAPYFYYKGNRMLLTTVDNKISIGLRQSINSALRESF
jgi:hypothetical protein